MTEAAGREEGLREDLSNGFNILVLAPAVHLASASS